MKICLVAKFGSGKNATFDILKTLNPNFKELKFASKMYEVMSVTQRMLGLHLFKDAKFLQFIGQHFKDLFGMEFWIRQVEEDNYLDENFLCLTDGRFSFEIEWARQNGFTIVKLVRDDELRMPFRAGRDPNHISETALDHLPDSTYDYIIKNDGTLDDLQVKVKILYDNLLSKY